MTVLSDTRVLDLRLQEETRAMIRLAVIDPMGVYRYLLTRRWGDGPPVLFVMLNPSTADAEFDDATARRCIGFASTWGYPAMEVVNLFALRAKDPLQLKLVRFDPVGPENTRYIREAARRAGVIVAAWGAHGQLFGRDLAVLDLLRERHAVYCLGKTALGFPRHPVRLSRATPLEVFAEQRPWDAVTLASIL